MILFVVVPADTSLSGVASRGTNVILFGTNLLDVDLSFTSATTRVIKHARDEIK